MTKEKVYIVIYRDPWDQGYQSIYGVFKNLEDAKYYIKNVPILPERGFKIETQKVF